MMSVQLSWTTVMKMLPAITPLVVFSVPAILVLMEMESTVQVRLVMAVMDNPPDQLILMLTHYAVVVITVQTTITS